MTKEYSKLEPRIDAIEGKLDRVIERLEALIRLEERHDGAVKRIDRMDGRLDRHAERLSALESESATQNKATSMLERAAWIAASAVVGVAAYFLRG